MDRAYLRPPMALYQLGVLAVIPMVLFVVGVGWSRWTLTPIQRHFLWSYAKVSVLPHGTKTNDAARQPKGRLPMSEVLVINVAGVDRLSETSNLTKFSSLDRWPMGRNLYEMWLQVVMFHGRPFFGLVAWPAGVAILILLALWVAAYRGDRGREAKFRDTPRQIRGPEKVTAQQFEKIHKGDGAGIRIEGEGWFKKTFTVHVARSVETQHLQVIGDNGAGKTQLITGIIDQAERRGEACVIYDPDRVYLPRYYNPDRGDVILGLDERGSGWNPSDEVDWSTESSARGTSLALAASQYPGHPGDRDWFFTSVCRDIMQFCLMNYRPTAERLAFLYSHADPLIDTIVKGHALEETLKENTSGTRPSIMGTLTTNILDMLSQIRTPSEEHSGWTAREYTKNPKGWVFLTSTEDTRISCGPLQRLWIDSIIRGMLSQQAEAKSDQVRVRMILDELWPLGQLGQLSNAMARGRKFGLAMVLGFQGRAQVKTVYGDNAESIFSAPYTKVFLRTGEFEAAKWVAGMIGRREVERIREQRDADGRRSHSTMRGEEDLIFPSELMGLKNRKGFLRYENTILPITIALAEQRRPRCEAYIPRKGKPPEHLPFPNLEEIKARENAERQLAAINASSVVFDASKFAAAKKSKRGGKRADDGQNGLWSGGMA